MNVTIKTRFQFLVTISAALALSISPAGSAQDAKRSFESKIPRHVPLEVRISPDKKAKVLDLNNKDWFRDFELEITNTSNKPIYYISLNLEVPDMITDSGPPGAVHFYHGR